MNSLRFLRNVPTAPCKLEKEVIVITMPKCGTHLLNRLITCLTGSLPSEESFQTRSVSEAHSILERHGKRSRRFLRGHLVHTPEIEKLLSDQNIRCVFMIRDPRDVVVSHSHWVTSELHGSNSNRLFYNALDSIEERIMTSICGRPEGWNEGNPGERERMSLHYHGVREHIGKRVGRYLPWFDSDAICTVKFEALIGPMGGGNTELQKNEIFKVADFLNVDVSMKDVQEISEGLFNPTAKTFRKGQVNGWKDHFNDLHRLVFKALAGKELIDLEYETGFDW